MIKDRTGKQVKEGDIVEVSLTEIWRGTVKEGRVTIPQRVVSPTYTRPQFELPLIQVNPMDITILE